MALIPPQAFYDRAHEAFRLSRLAFAGKDAEIAGLREQVVAAGLPDDQVPVAPVDSAELDQFLADMQAAAGQAEPGVPTDGDILPGLDVLPEPPAVGGNEPPLP